MQTVWKGRLTEAATRYGEYAPQATTCCNACRTCVQSNLLTIAAAGVAGAGVAVTKLAKRVLRPAHAADPS
jgi:hypothetical protein